MSRKKAGICACGHELGYWHDEDGRCTYGAGAHGEPTVKRCTCQRKGKTSHAHTGGERADVIAALTTIAESLQEAANALSGAASACYVLKRELSSKARAKPMAILASSGPAPKANGHALPSPTPADRTEGQDGEDWLRGGRRAVLLAIAQRGKLGASHAWIAVQTGYKPTSRRTYLTALTSAGYIRRGERDEFYATEAGTIVLGPFEALPTGQALIDHWLAKLPDAEATIFNQVVRHEECSTAVLESDTGYKTTSVRTYLNRLAARQLVSTRKGIVRLSDELR